MMLVPLKAPQLAHWKVIYWEYLKEALLARHLVLLTELLMVPSSGLQMGHMKELRWVVDWVSLRESKMGQM